MRRAEVKRLQKQQHNDSSTDDATESSRAPGEQQQQQKSTQQQNIATVDGEPLRLEWRWGTRLDEADPAWVFDLFKRNMRELYLKSQWGYDEKAKQQELTATTARYLLVRNASAHPVAYVHFRFVEDEGRAVLYCFELQVEPDYQQKGIGAQLIDRLEQLAKATQMELLMATVFAFNSASLAFFHKRGFRTDSSCRFGRDGANGRDFMILSKQLPRRPDDAKNENEKQKEEEGSAEKDKRKRKK
uniref:N-alpha-acetyltransferase 40 n=1 Tax=Globodera rostochiensis TaxID=31243 RepID=A0A914I7Z6_GLORO